MSENKNLKVRFKLKELEFEIEGQETTVKEEFENFKSFVTNDILPQLNSNSESESMNKIESSEPLSLNQAEDIESVDVTDYPVMKEIVFKDLPAGEQDWVLIYAFYASKFGTETFERSDINDFYESSNRKTKERISHISRNLKRILKKDYIKFHNETEYIFKEEGIEHVKVILNGKSRNTSNFNQTKTKAKTQKKNSSKKSSTTTGFKLDRNLNLRPENKISLIDFSQKFKLDSTPARILVIVFYLKDILELDSVNPDHIYTGFEKLKIRVPKSLYQLISDTKNKNGWLDFDSMDNIDLSIQGKNAVKYDLPIE